MAQTIASLTKSKPVARMIRCASADCFAFAYFSLVRFKVDVAGQQTYYLRCETTGSMKIPMKLFDPERFQELAELRVIEIGFFCGIIIAMLAYNSFLAFTVRDINDLYYIGYIGLLLASTLSLNGMAFQYLWPHNVWLANYSIPLTIYSSAFFALLFSTRFLRTDRHVPIADKFIRGLKIWALVGMALMAFIPYKTTTQSCTALTLVLNFILMTTGLILVKRGHRSARFYMIAFAGIWCGMAAKAMQILVSINDSKLGRSTTADEMTVSRRTLEETVRFLRQFSEQPLTVPIRQELQELTQGLMDIIYHSSTIVLNDILKHANTLARDLHKAEPDIRIESIPVNLTSTGEDLLRKVFLHLIRNSLDHGIEFPDERLAKGKQANGTIQVIMDQPDPQSMRIRYRDDGRGINIARLKQIAGDFGLLNGDDLQDALKIAYSIFADGISTSKAVTDISGRGVGMGAIKEYVERLGGSIELKIYPDNKDSEFLPFELVLFAPSQILVA